MNHISPEELARISGVSLSDNLNSVHEGLSVRGEVAGLAPPARLVHFMAQVSHESMGFRYDREIWDGKGAQARYDTRTDLGNTPEVDGDGYRNRGRTAIQITGGHNIREFTTWVRTFYPSAPEFIENPDLLNTDPYEGLGPIWYWETRRLNRYADTGDIEMVTKLINGGYNGLADRLDKFTEIGLRVLGYGPGDVRRFQGDSGLAVDGISGRRTRGAIQLKLQEMPNFSFTENSGVPRTIQHILDDMAKLFRELTEYTSR